MPLVSGGVPTRQRGAPKRPAVLGWVAAVFGRFLQFAVEPNYKHLGNIFLLWKFCHKLIRHCSKVSGNEVLI